MARPLDSEAKTADSTAPVILEPFPKAEEFVRARGLMEGLKAYDSAMAVWLRKFQNGLGPLIESVKTGEGG